MSIETGLQIKRRGRPPKLLVSMADVTQAAHEPIDMRIQSSIIERIAHWAYRLELANAMKAGVMDSESRHLEIAAQRQAIIASVIAEMRA